MAPAEGPNEMSKFGMVKHRKRGDPAGKRNQDHEGLYL